MKITDQNVPPPLRTLFFSLVSTNTTGTGAGKRARTRRARKVRATKPRASTTYNDLKQAIEILCDRLNLAKNSKERKDKIKEQLAKIKAGEWDARYWIPCRLLSTDYLQCAPASIPDPNPPPYAYRTPANLPTIPTYTDGTLSSGPARFTGASSGGYFRDTLLVWARHIYKLDNATLTAGSEPTLIDYSAEVSANADRRGSRPMLSVVLRLFLYTYFDPEQFTTMNPVEGMPPSSPPGVHGCQNLYWRYRIPNTPPPFFSIGKTRRIIRELHKVATLAATGITNRATILACPRPMFGRGFNNNTSVTTQVTNAPAVYQIAEMEKGSWQYFIAYAEEMPGTYDSLDYYPTLTHTICVITYASQGGDFQAESKSHITRQGEVFYFWQRRIEYTDADNNYHCIGFMPQSKITYAYEDSTKKFYFEWDRIRWDYNDLGTGQLGIGIREHVKKYIGEAETVTPNIPPTEMVDAREQWAAVVWLA